MTNKPTITIGEQSIELRTNTIVLTWDKGMVADEVSLILNLEKSILDDHAVAAFGAMFQKVPELKKIVAIALQNS